MVISAGTGHGKADELMERAGIARNVKLRVPHFVAVGQLLRGSDLIATLPERLAKSVAEPFGLAYVSHLQSFRRSRSVCSGTRDTSAIRQASGFAA